MTQVFLAGMAVVDFIFSVDQLPNTAEKHRASDAHVVGGGCAANAAVAVARLGGKATLAACLGDDPLGDLILSDLQREGVDTASIQRISNGRSSFSSIFVDRGGERQIMNFRGAGLTPYDMSSAQKFKADAVLADTRWSELIEDRPGRMVFVVEKTDVRQCDFDDCYLGATYKFFYRNRNSWVLPYRLIRHGNQVDNV